ncbi:hypothetical protein [Halalkalibacter alkalisediminis]|uniref:Uncharacterized protein n=1 Tax=Halalkalibacter alkalisediminis TaxID=935616 RepID=A0ABV6NQ95_9BACI|nr:hypothetical protein [Halalkalibacter alkalisediminis]
MEHLAELFHTQSNWLIIIGSIIAVFLLVSLLKILFKFTVVLIVVSMAAVFLFNIAPEDLAETGVDSLKTGSEFLQEKMIPLLTDFYLGQFFNNENEASEQMNQLLEHK